MSQTRTEDDSTLIEAYRHGDDAALSALVQRHQTQVYRLALGVLTSPHEAEDATQESLMAMLQSLARFRGDSSFSTWLFRLTLNTCLKRRRSSGRRHEEPLLPDAMDLPAPAEGRPDAEASRRWLRDRVANFLAALPNTYRVPVVLSDILDLTASEVAGVLDISLAAAKARLLRGRRRLRSEIERYCEESGLSGWRELVS